MRKRDKAGLSMAPVLLRVALGVTFLWTGLAKWFGEIEVSGEQAAVLANVGLIQGPGGTATPSAPFQGETPAESPQESPEEGGGALGPGREAVMVPVRYQTSGTSYTAADFPNPVKVKMVYGLVPMLYGASHPGFDDATGVQQVAIWPPVLGEGQTVVWLARAVGIGEVLCGFGMLVGLLARLSGLGIATIMLGAIWLSELGPAIQSGNTTLGFLPAYPAWALQEWQSLLWQLSLLCSALAVMLLGAGALSVDSVVFGPRSATGEDLETDDEPED